MYKEKYNIGIIYIICITLVSLSYGAEQTISSSEEGMLLLSGESSYTNLIETTYDDANWVLVTSDGILNEFRCDLINYEYVFNPCHAYLNRYWKFPPCTDIGKAFTINEVRVPDRTTDSLYVRHGYGFQLYENLEEPLDPNDLIPYGPFMEGPQYVSLSKWVCSAFPAYGFEPKTFFAEGQDNGLVNYSIIITRNLMNLQCVSDVGSSCVEPSTPLEENLITYSISYENDLKALSDPNDPNSDCVNSDADNVFIIDTLPVSVDFNSCSGAGEYEPNEHRVVWELGNIEYGAGDTLTVTVKVNEYAAPGNPIENICNVTGEYSLSGETFSYSVAEDTNVCCYCDTVFVDINATGKNSGTSWQDAFTDVQSALDAAKNCPGMDVWIADGHYSPSFNGLCTFEIPDYTNVYGGFHGGEESLNQRDLLQGSTILDGDSFEVYYNQSKKVVITGDQSVLDGVKAVDGIETVILCDGKSSVLGNCTVSNAGSADGIICNNNANLTVVDSNITDNGSFGLRITDSNAAVSGTSITANPASGVYCDNCQLVMEYCTVAGNGHEGLKAEDSNIMISNSTFCENSGSGIYGESSEILIDNCLVEKSSMVGIFAYLQSAVDISNSHLCYNNYRAVECRDGTTLTLDNSRIYGNGEGGRFKDQAPVIRNSIFYNNEYWGIFLDSLTSGGVIINTTVVNNGAQGIYLYSGSHQPSISSCIVWGNSGSQLDDCNATYSCVQNGPTNNGNINDNPLFYVDPCDSNNFHLTSSSPCVDAGDPCFVPYEGELDVDGEYRVIDGDDNGIARVDMGADEYYHSKADLDLSEYVDFIDYSIFANAWFSESGAGNYSEDCDIEDNNSIDTNDLDLFCEDWLWKAGWRKTTQMIMAGLEGRVGGGLIPSVSLVTASSSTAMETQLPVPAPDIEEQIKDLLDWVDGLWESGELAGIMTYEQYIEFRESIELTAGPDY